MKRETTHVHARAYLLCEFGEVLLGKDLGVDENLQLAHRDGAVAVRVQRVEKLLELHIFVQEKRSEKAHTKVCRRKQGYPQA